MENIDKLLKDKLESYRPDFDAAAWGTFSSKLEKVQLPFYKRWFGAHTIIGFMLLVTGTFLVYFWPTNNEIPTFRSAEGGASVDTVFVHESVYLENPSSEFTDPEGESHIRPLNSGKVTYRPPGGPAYTSTIPEKVTFTNGEIQSISEYHSTPKPSLISEKNSHNARHWQDTISEREMMKYLFGTPDSAAASTVEAHPFEVFGDSFEAKKTNHVDLNAGPLLRLMYPVDGFVTEEEGFLNPGFRVSMVWNKRFSLNIGIQSGKNIGRIENVEELSEESLIQFPDWDDFHFEVENIRIDTDQLYLPIDVAYYFSVFQRVGVHLKAGVVPHYIRQQDFYYDPYALASFPGERAHTAPKTWQISYLQSGLGINYQISRRFSTHLDELVGWRKFSFFTKTT